MKNYKNKTKIVIDPYLLNKLTNSFVLNENEKLNFLKYIAYLTQNEKKQLCNLV